MKKLENVTLFGIDCVNIERLIVAAEICKKDFEFAEVKLLTSLPSNHTDVIQIEPVDSIRAYSEFMLKKAADYISTDYVLVVQHDGFILNPDAWSEEFLQYDYIGAPFLVNDKLVVGNGGFSMRSRKLFELTKNDLEIQLGDKTQDRYAENEDWVLSILKRKHLEDLGIRYAPVELAHTFSLEENKVYGGIWNGQFGFHGLRWTDIRSWLIEHPEYPIENPLDKV